SFFERLFRRVVLNYIPSWIQARNNIKVSSYRPQLTWLPFAPNHGTGPVLPQRPSKRYQEEQKRARATSTA
ncbi:hypothetical protein BGZ80_002127, partial [Entomortierella chlamydospora]